MSAIEEICKERIEIKETTQAKIQFKADYFTALQEFNSQHLGQLYSLDYAISWITRYLVKHYDYQPRK